MSLGSIVSGAISFVEKIGQEIMHGLSDAAVITQKVQPVANFVGSIISAVDPELAPAVKLVLSTTSYIEGQFAAAGNATGTGSQKMSTVTALIGDTVAHFLTQAGKSATAQDVEDFISKIVNIGKDDPNIWQELLAMLGQTSSTPVTSAPAAVAAASAAHTAPAQG